MRRGQWLVIIGIAYGASVSMSYATELVPVCLVGRYQVADNSALERAEALYIERTGSVIKGMQGKLASVKPTGCVGLDFVLQMRVLCQGAVGLSKEEYKYGSQQCVKGLAQEIMHQDDTRVKELDALLLELEGECGKKVEVLQQRPGKEDEEYLRQYQEICQKMAKEMAAVKPTGTIDDDFLHQIVAAYQAKYDVASAVSKYTQNPVLKEFAQAMVTTHDKQIEVMKQMMTEKGNVAK